MLGYLSTAAFALVLFAAQHWFGPAAPIRVIGSFFLLAAVYGITEPQVDVGLGREWTVSVDGWMKALVLIVMAGIGIALLVYAPDIACAKARNRHLCQG